MLQVLSKSVFCITFSIVLLVLRLETFSTLKLIYTSRTTHVSAAQQDAIIVSSDMHILSLSCSPSLSHTQKQENKSAYLTPVVL